jgi:hypothetical protein
MGAVYLLSHYALYVSKVAPEDRKFNPKWPSQAQHSRDRAATLLSLSIGSAYEVGARGRCGERKRETESEREGEEEDEKKSDLVQSFALPFPHTHTLSLTVTRVSLYNNHSDLFRIQ